jgi:tetratricopeptide (TPR) repeat protein
MLGHRTIQTAILLVSLIGIALGQTVNPAEKKDSAQEETAIIQQIRTVVRMENDGRGTVESLLRAKMLSVAGAQQFGLLTFPYIKDVAELEIVSVTVKKGDGTVVETPADSIQDMVADVSHDAPFFTGLREKHVPVKSLGAGDVLEYKIRETYKTPLIPNQVWYQYNFTTGGVVEAEEFELDVPKGRTLNLKTDKLKPAVSEQGDRKIYTWKTSHPSTKEKVPPVLAGHLPWSDVEVSTFASWAELGQWMAKLYEDRAVPTPEITAKALQLTKDAKTDDEKMRALYAYVSMQYRYTGIAIGPGRWQPHTAADVFSNQFGDCKDKHTLLAAMLKAVGIPALPVLMNSSRILDKEVPSPSQFDHVMTYVPREKEPVWLDTTMEVSPYGYIVFSMRNKQGLVLDGERSRLEEVPQKKYESWEEFHAESTLSSEGTLEAELTREVRGDTEIAVRGAFRRVGPGKYRELAQNVSYASGFAGSVSDVVVEPLEDTNKPIEIKYHYNRKDYADWENRRIVLPMPALGLPAISEEPERAKDPIIIGIPTEYRYYSKMKLPKGYSATLPANMDVSREFANYHVRYNLEEGMLVAERFLTIKEPIVKPEQLESYKSFRKTMNDDLERYIVLSSEGKALASAPTTAHRPTEEVQDLVEQARNAFNMRDAAGMRGFIQRALDKDPKIENGWMMLATAQLALGQQEEALGSMRKQIEVTPRNFSAYRMLGTTLEQLKKREEAIPVWRKLLAIDPENTEAIYRIASNQFSLKRYAESVAELEAGLLKKPDNYQLEFLLAQSYLKTGDKQKGLDLARKAVEKNPTADTMNSAAYFLADANEGLDDSLKWAIEAVSQEEGRRLDVKVDELSVKDPQHAALLSAYWDTLGWVYFRRGDYALAEKYLKASWGIQQDFVTGEHLSEVYEKQHKTQMAAKTLAQAYVAGMYKDDDAKKHIQKLVGPALAGSLIGLAGSELSQMRTVKIPAAGVGHASSDFWVVLTPAKVEQVKLVSSTEKKLENALLAAKFVMPFPTQNAVKIVRKGIVFCSGGPTCDAVVYPLEASNP